MFPRQSSLIWRVFFQMPSFYFNRPLKAEKNIFVHLFWQYGIRRTSKKISGRISSQNGRTIATILSGSSIVSSSSTIIKWLVIYLCSESHCLLRRLFYIYRLNLNIRNLEISGVHWKPDKGARLSRTPATKAKAKKEMERREIPPLPTYPRAINYSISSLIILIIHFPLNYSIFFHFPLNFRFFLINYLLGPLSPPREHGNVMVDGKHKQE
jgi:hypothetical protein